MKTLHLIAFIVLLNTMIFGQNSKTLIADGTLDVPEKYSLQPKIEDLSKQEIEFVKTEVLKTQPVFDFTPQMVLDETEYRGKFNLIDVAEGFFVSREFKSKAFLYMAWNEKSQRNYNGVIVVKTFANGTKFEVAAHYAYQFRNDKFIRQISDINGNFISELAIFDEPPTKKIERKNVRIIEFSPDGLEKLGLANIYLRYNKPQRTPLKRDKSKPVKRTYDPPDIRGIKIFAEKDLGGKLKFSWQEFTRYDGVWKESVEETELKLETDQTKYVEIVKTNFPKSISEK